MTASKFQLAATGHIELASRIDRRIAMEAGFLSSFATTVREVIPSMLTSINNALASLNLASPEKQLTYSYTVFTNLLKNSNFVEMSETKISVPEGFVGHLSDYILVLKACAEHSSKVVNDVLTPYNIFLSQLLSSENSRLANIGQLGYLAKMDAERDSLNADIGNFFSKGATHVEIPMGQVLTRNSDWSDILMNQSAARQTINQVDRKKVQSIVDDCVSLIDAVKKLSENGEFDSISGPMIRQLSGATLSVAREVEFYSATVYRINLMNKVVSDNVDMLTKELKK